MLIQHPAVLSENMVSLYFFLSPQRCRISHRRQCASLLHWKLSLCQSILLAPDTELIQHSHQRFSSFRKRIFHLRRNLRILGADDQFIRFQLLDSLHLHF